MVCNNAYIRDNKPMGHPTEAAILGVGLKAGLQGLADQYVRSEERAFSSEHKWMAVRSRLRSTNKFEVTFKCNHGEDVLFYSCLATKRCGI